MSRALALLLLVPACESVKSTDVTTGSIYPDFSVVTQDAITTATAMLRTGGATSNTFVSLEAGDTLAVTGGAETVPMAEVNLGEYYAYVATLAATDAGTTFTFAFEREVGDSAPASSATLPDGLAFTAPAADAVLSRGEPLTVTWEPSGLDDDIEVELESECILDATVAVSGDPGTYTYEVGSYEVLDSMADQSCEATLHVRRIRHGALDPAFTSGGNVWAAQQANVSVRLDP